MERRWRTPGRPTTSRPASGCRGASIWRLWDWTSRRSPRSASGSKARAPPACCSSMTSSCDHNGTFKVFVLMETSREYGRGLLRGIYRYSSLHRQWQIMLGGDGLGSWGTDDRHLISAGVDGIIMRDHRGAPALLGRGIPIVFASQLHKNIRGSHRIVPDDQAIGRLAAAHLLERGFHHFAFVGYDGLYW